MKKTIVSFALFCTSMAFSQMVGNDKDKHGCIGSAGYTYSQVKNDCVKLFDQKIKLTEVNPKGTSTSFTPVIFSSNKKKAEVFLPNQESGSIILYRVGKGKIWKKGNYILVPYKKYGYQLKKDNVVIYR